MVLLAVSACSLLTGFSASSHIKSVLDKPGRYRGDLAENSRDGSTFVWIPGGTFLFGEAKKRLYLRGFWMQQSLVTEAQFARFCAETGYEPQYKSRNKKSVCPQRIDPDRPATNFSYFDAEVYARWARCTIPIEPMWEKAARSARVKIYHWGNTMSPANENDMRILVDNSTRLERKQAIYRIRSPYGCLECVGTECQWTSTGRFGEPVTRFIHPENEIVQIQVIKGGLITRCSDRSLLEAGISPLTALRLAHFPNASK